MDVGRPLSTAEPCRRLSWWSHDTMIAPSKLGRAGRSLGWGTGSQKTRLQSSRTNATPAFRAADGEGKGTDSTTSYGRLQRPCLWLSIFAGSADVPTAYRFRHNPVLPAQPFPRHRVDTAASPNHSVMYYRSTIS